MRVSLLKKEKLRSINIPDDASGNFWVTDYDDNGKEVNLVSISVKDGIFNLISNEEFACVYNQKNVAHVELKPYSFNFIEEKSTGEVMIIYSSPSWDGSMCGYLLQSVNNFISIGNSTCNICFKYLDVNHAKIVMENDKYVIYALSNKGGVYVNNIKVTDKKILNLGDIIFINGLKFVFVKDGQRPVAIFYNYGNLLNIEGLNSISLSVSEDNFIEANDDLDMKWYMEEDYFHKTPRFMPEIIEKEVKIDAPPEQEKEPDMPVILTIGPMFTMSMSSVVMALVSINNVRTQGISIISVLPTIVMAFAMLLGTLVWPIITRKYQDKKRAKKEKERIDKYSRYIDKKRKIIIDELNNQAKILRHTYPTLLECQQIILNKKNELWQKRIEDDDFLKVSLGFGNYPMDLKITYPEEHFTMVEDDLKDIADKLSREPKILSDVPLTYSFLENNITSVVGNYENRFEFIKKILLQIITFHSYIDLKIVIFTDDDKKSNWTNINKIPHCFSDDKKIRFFASNKEEYNALGSYLEKIFDLRSDDKQEKNRKQDKIYLIITDSFRMIRNVDFIDKILDAKENLGFSFIILNNMVATSPEQCKSFINVGFIDGYLTKNVINGEKQKFVLDLFNDSDYNECLKTLSNTPIETKDNRVLEIPEKVSFLEMFDVGRVEQLNSPNRWKTSNPMSSLKTAVGIAKNDELLYIDLHEKAHGPHGLIAGMTGSGKSEFIISYILSLAVNYNPLEVQFILIDYKGGGLAGAFENANSGKKLPHLVGVITNLDKSEIKRTLSSIESELKRRQRLFNIARDKTGESTVDIYKYQRLYREGKVDDPVSHLFIISDEFAELKTQQPEFMDQLISTARIGRSLGVHLILATQKPSGVVDPQIWSNTRFRVCLRVQDKGDSNEVIKCPDAAFLKQTGRFYFQVGYNEVFTLGQAAWAGGQYIPKEKTKKQIDTSIDFINNLGQVFKSIETKEIDLSKKVKNLGEELPNIVNYLSDVAKEEKLLSKPLWLDKIPSFININVLIDKYNFKASDKIMDIPVGEYDIPQQQSQNLLKINFIHNGNAILYGSAGSGKENFIMTLIYSAMKLYTPWDINFYIMDFGAEVLKVFENSVYVGGVVSLDDSEKIKNLYKMILSMIEERKDLFSGYGGNYESYIESSNNKLPLIIIVLNNYEAYYDVYEGYEDLLNTISRDCSKFGIYFFITCNTPNGVRFKLKQNFSQVYSLQQNNEDDYSIILGNVNKNYPSKIFGRGIFKANNVYEFQTAYIDKKENINNTINDLNLELKNKYKYNVKKIPVLPKIVKFEDVSYSYDASLDMVIGIEKNDLNIVKYNFKKKLINVISSNDSLLFTRFLDPFLKQLKEVNNIFPFVLAADDFNISSSCKKGLNYEEDNLNDIFEKILKYEIDCYNLYEENNYNIKVLETQKPLVVVINGLESFKNKLNSENKNKLDDFINSSKGLGLVNFIIVDTIENIKKNEYEQWFRKGFTTSDVIWIGNGFNDQYTFKSSIRMPELKENIGDDFCVVLQSGRPSLVKYVSEFEKDLYMFEE